jgi:hypothetical protein
MFASYDIEKSTESTQVVLSTCILHVVINKICQSPNERVVTGFCVYWIEMLQNVITTGAQYNWLMIKKSSEMGRVLSYKGITNRFNF